MGSGLFPLFLMVLVQFVYAGMNITSKLAMLSGMNPLILVAYRQIFATLSIVPFAYWLEWKTLPKMTKRIMYQIILSSLLGVLGSLLIVLGLYSVLWGKNKEMNNEDTIDLTIIESIKDNEKEEKNDLKL
ncbi:hypothetical protein TanjilG_07469 [Lupinus angustifolius]|uniref:WAT1-related protein n=1 Tax=Lupinus angustifolius TaxID=3871 RepID=A0A4P1QUS7_LUPAN|nr:hypothetical protein TanjilG_07469 [Lupinus angustifolius]